jgi:hypothetical protein
LLADLAVNGIAGRDPVNVPAGASLVDVAFGIDPRATADLTYRLRWASLMPDPVLEYNPGSPKSLRTDNTRAAARALLATEAQILRAAGKLLYDLTRRSVYSDLSGAEQRRSEVVDPLRGNRIAWGEEGVYNSYAHAARVLFGRWEMGPSQPDPRCAGVASGSLLLDASARDRSARVEDEPISTRSQALASQLIESAGIVLPACRANGASDDTLRAAISAQLLANIERTSGVRPPPSGPVAEAVRRTVNELPAADLRFALARAGRTLRMLANLPAEPSTGQTCAFPAALGPVDELPRVNELTALGGRVIAGGLDRGRLAADTSAWAAPMRGASQCRRTESLWSPYGGWTHTTLPPLPASVPVPRVVFQDVAHLGQAIGRELRKIQTVTTNLPPLSRTGLTDPNNVSRAGVAELKSWAGTGAFVIVDANASSVTVEISGVDLDRFSGGPGVGMDDAARRYASTLRAVVGAPWVAECAAGTRVGCAARVTSLPVTFVELSYVTPAQAAQAAANGIDRPFRVRIDRAFPTNVSSGELLYIVQPSTAPSGVKPGTVLGAFAPQTAVADAIGLSFVLSPLQEELAEMVFGVGKWVGERPPRVGSDPTSLSAGYCVEGVRRNDFVPLENELTSDSDPLENSWRHYLRLAREAAERADALGKDVIERGLRRDEREEAAGEVLGAICGDYSASSRTRVNERGDVVPTETDETLSACLKEPTIDVVLFSELPSELRASPTKPLEPKSPTAATTAFLRTQVLRCKPTGETNELCLRKTLSEGGSHNELTFATLGVTAQPPPSARPTHAVEPLKAAADSLRTGFSVIELNKALDDPSATTQWFRVFAPSMRMIVAPNAMWHVEVAGKRIIDANTHPDPAEERWPGCMRGGRNCKNVSGTYVDSLAPMWNSLFRWCPEADVQEAKLGTCSSAAGSPIDEAAELHSIRWRIAGAMWQVAALAGQSTHGMVTIPMPVLTVPRYTTASLLDSIPFTYVGEARPRPNAGYDLFIDGQIHGTPPGRVFEFGVAYQRTMANRAFFTNFDQFAGNEIPAWYRKAQLEGDIEQHWVHSAAVAYDQGWAQGNPPVERTMREVAALTGFAGETCTAPVGGFAGAGNNVRGSARAELYRLLTLPKLNYQDRLNYLGLGAAPFDPRRPETYWERGANLGALSEHVIGKGFTPEARAVVASNYGPARGECGALVQSLGALAIARASYEVPTREWLRPTAPKISNVNDIALLEAWMRLVSSSASLQVKALYLEKVPNRVLEDYRAQVVGSGSKKGEKGIAYLQMQGALTRIPRHWARVATSLDLIGTAIQSARLGLTAADISKNERLNAIASQQINIQATLAQEVTVWMQVGLNLALSAAGYWSGNLQGFMNAAASAQSTVLSFDATRAQARLLDASMDDAERARFNTAAQVLQGLQASTSSHWLEIQSALGDLRADTAELLAAAERLQQLQDKAKLYAARGAGEDFVNIDGQTVGIPVNTVMRRLQDATTERYRRALVDAKALTFMARKSIEQRIGVPLNSITTGVGPLAPPASWADQLCRLNGINYDKLREGVSPKIPANERTALENQAVSEFADAFIGDYVARLESFMQYYNAAFPSQQGDDTAVLSLREDLLSSSKACSSTAPNYLIHSGGLERSARSGDGTPMGWVTRGCTESSSSCLVTLPGAYLPEPRGGPSASTSVIPGNVEAPEGRGVTWLLDVARAAVGGGAPMSSVEPAGAVTQGVYLTPGRYVLSWWAQARAVDGALPTSTSPETKYQAAVWDRSWTPLASRSEAAWRPAPGALWGARQELRVTITEPGVYQVGFRASDGGIGGGSVAIANAQLEADGAGAPTAYVETGASRTVVGRDCPLDDAGMRALFRRDCDAQRRCYFELTRPLHINTESLRDGASKLVGKVARGNYNFRHLELAVNFVGTGVRDCRKSPSANCYSTGYLEYDLQHEALAAGILDWHGDQRLFNFGIGRVNHGKALAADRVISMPMSQTDSGMLQQAGILKPELRGRPLDGTYTLRIWDDPALNWDRLEDIQLVLRYRYWSRIDSRRN